MEWWTKNVTDQIDDLLSTRSTTKSILFDFISFRIISRKHLNWWPCWIWNFSFNFEIGRSKELLKLTKRTWLAKQCSNKLGTNCLQPSKWLITVSGCLNRRELTKVANQEVFLVRYFFSNCSNKSKLHNHVGGSDHCHLIEKFLIDCLCKWWCC
jgi:hypothetical protein